MRTEKKAITVRLHQEHIELLHKLQEHYQKRSRYKVSQADVIEQGLDELHKKAKLESELYYEQSES